MIEEIYTECIKCKNNYRPIIIYGAGLIGHLLYRSLLKKCDVKIDFFCTSFEPEYIDPITGIRVLNKDSLYLYKHALIIVAIGITYSKEMYKEIENFILNAGIPRENIILNPRDWILYEAQPYMDSDEKLNIFTLSFHVTKQCNLHCKLCGELLFGLVKRRSFPSTQIINDTRSIFSFIDYIHVMKLIGGEVFMYSKLDELIYYLNEFKDKIGLLEIYTNGAMDPKKKVLDAISAYSGNIQITISDYGDLSTAKKTLVQFGKKHDIKVNVLGFVTEEKSGYKAWIDCSKVIDLGETDEELAFKFMNCGQRLDFVLEDSILGKCTSFHMLNYALNREINRTEAIYLHDDTTRNEKRQKLLDFSSHKKYLDICRYCVWGTTLRENLPRVPAAEQME